MSLPAQEGLRVWLISPQPLPGVPAVAVAPEETDLAVVSDHQPRYRCEDLSAHLALDTVEESDTVGLTVATARRPRRLCDLDAAALGQPTTHPESPDELQTHLTARSAQ